MQKSSNSTSEVARQKNGRQKRTSETRLPSVIAAAKASLHLIVITSLAYAPCTKIVLVSMVNCRPGATSTGDLYGGCGNAALKKVWC